MKNTIKIIVALLSLVICFQTINAQTASFSYYPSSSILVGEAVSFVNTSTGFTSSDIMIWDYNDFSCFPSGQQPTPGPGNQICCKDTIIGLDTAFHTFSYPGTFTVTLTTISGTSTFTYSQSISVFTNFQSCGVAPVCEWVDNGNLESFNTCQQSVPFLMGGNLNCWSTPPNHQSTDYYNACTASSGVPPWGGVPCNWVGYENPHSGYGYAGLLTKDPSTFQSPYREYLQQQLSNPLMAGETYLVSFWVSLSEESDLISDIGILLSPNQPANTFSFISGSPQVAPSSPIQTTAGWTQVAQLFTPTVQENWITIGNFHDDANSHISGVGPVGACAPGMIGLTQQAYYYIDDISIKRIINAQITGLDPPFCFGGSSTVTVVASGGASPYSYQWSNGATTATVTLTPTTSGTHSYTVTVTDADGCTVSASTTITVYPLPIVYINNSNPNICIGQGQPYSILTAIPNGNPFLFNYLWSTLPISTSQQIQTPNYTSSGTHPYLVIVTDINGCTASATTTVTVNQPPTVTVSSSVTICRGQSTTLTAGGASTYTWSPSTGLSGIGASVMASPLTTTTYTVTGSDSYGCTGTASVTVTVLPAPVPPVITGFNNNCINFSGATIYTIQNHNDYTNFSSWTMSANLSLTPGAITNPNAPWEAYVDYTNSSFISNNPAPLLCIDVESSDGCSRTGCVPIYECCHSCDVPVADVEINNLSADDIFNLYSVQYASIIDIQNPNTLDFHLNNVEVHCVINGELIVDRDLTIINGKSLCMGPQAKITIKPGYHLYMGSGGNDPDDTRLHAGCNVMWDGIYISDNSAHFMTTGSLTPFVLSLRDARNAVVSNNGGDFNIQNTDFVDNNAGIVMNAYSQGQHSGYLASSVLHSSSSSIVPLLPFYPDYQQTQNAFLQNGLPRGRTGIEINNVLWTILGDGSSSALQNTFKYIDCGINAHNSSVFSFNNRFEHIRQIFTPPPTAPFFPYGNCIYSTQDAGSIIATTIGGTNQSEKNIFEDADAGIATWGGIQSNNITWNEFTNVHAGISIQHTNSIFSDMYINHNTLDNFFRGIYLWDNRLANIEVGNNTFNGIYNTTQVSTAIIGWDVGNAGPYLNIHDNNINRVTKGIQFTNQRSFQYVSDIVNNHIIFNINHPASLNSIGIQLQNNNKTNVLNNEIYRCSAYIPMNSTPATTCFPDASYITKLQGISVETSSLTNIFNNMMGYLGNGMTCLNVNMQNYFNCNVMGYCQRGVSLLASSPGIQGNMSKASDNQWRWDAQWGFTPQWDVFGSSSPLLQRWYTRIGSLPYTTSSMNPPTQIAFQIGATINGDCSYPIPPVKTPEELQSELADNVAKVLDPGCPLSEESKFMTLLEVYKELMYNPSLLNLGTQYDSYLQTFFDDATNSNIGQIANIRFLIGEEDYSNAENENSNITPDDQSQQNEKDVNSIYLVTWAQDIYTFTQEQYDLLTSIAEQNPISGGSAVYDARVMLGVDYDDLGSEERLDNSAKQADNYLRVYPNPARDEVYIDYNLDDNQKGMVVLYDMNGRELLREALEGGMNIKTISTSMLSNGIYQIQLSADGKLIGNVKLAIMK